MCLVHAPRICRMFFKKKLLANKNNNALDPHVKELILHKDTFPLIIWNPNMQLG